MADVNQSLGFDASGAVKSLEQLSFTIDTVNQRIRTMEKTAKGNPLTGIEKGAKTTEATISRLEKKVRTLQSQLTKTGQAGQKAGNDITVSWQTMARVVQTQVIVRSLSELQRQFFETGQAARDFELQIARITTIAGDEISAETDQLSASVRGLAVELGRDIGEVSGAAFQTLQNDIGNVAESLDFLRSSSKLATVQGSELETAMNALTSVFKVYGEEAGNASDAADTLFTAVDVGRLTIDELAGRLGTVISPAKQLGFEFEQVAAAAASLTQTGLDTATATTQLRNIILKLVRPTESLQGAIEGLGFATSKELVSSLGGELLPTLQALRTELGGTDEDVARAFGTFRGQLGVFNLLAQEGELFSDILDQFDDKAGNLTKAFDKVEQTNARDYEKELAAVNDTLLELGQSAAQIQTGFVSLFNDLIPDAQAAQAVLVGLGVAGSAAFLKIAGGAVAARIAASSLLGPVGLLSIALGTVAGISFANLPDGLKTFQEATATLGENLANISDQAKLGLDKSLSDLKSSLSGQVEEYEKFFQQIDSLYEQDQQRFEDRATRLAKTSERVLKDFVEGREDLLKGIDGFLESIDDRIVNGIDRVSDSLQELEEFQFDQAQKGLTEVQQAFNELSRAQRTALEAQRAFNNAGVNPELLAQARELQDLAEERARDALRTAESSDSQGAIQQATANVQKVLQQAAKAETDQVERLQSINQTLLGEERDRLAILLEQEKSLGNQIAALNSRRKPEGGDKTSEDILNDSVQSQALGVDLQSIQEQIKGLRLIDDAGLRDLEQSSRDAFQKGIFSVRFDFNTAVAELETAISAKTYGIELQIINQSSLNEQVSQILGSGEGLALGADLRTQQQGLVALLEEQRTAASTAAEATREFDEFGQSIQRFNVAAGESRSLTDNFKAGLLAIRANLKPLSSDADEVAAANKRAFEAFANSDPAIQTGNELISLFERLRVEGSSAGEEVAAAADRIQASLTNGTFNQDQITEFKSGLDNLRSAIEAISNRENALQIIDPEAAAEAQRILNNFSMNFSNIETSATATKTATTGLTSATSSAQSAAAQLQTTWQGIAAAASSAAQSAAAASPGRGGFGINSNFFGGFSHKNTGGDLTRGQDQQLVAAQAGEFITNARSSQRFFAELRAMNSGQAPVFREQGGPVTNIGDINVNVDASNASSVDGRDIARTLNRELRRSNSSLRG